MQPLIPDFISPFGEQALAAWASEAFVAGVFQQPGAWRLSIARADGSPTPMSWEELMQVKRDCGFASQDALEVYPCDEDVFNTGNIRHLYFVGPVGFALRKNTHTLQQSNPHELKEQLNG